MENSNTINHSNIGKIDENDSKNPIHHLEREKSKVSRRPRKTFRDNSFQINVNEDPGFFKLIIHNFNAALVNVIVSIPCSLSIIMVLNSQTNKDNRIDPSLAVITLIFGYFMSYIINGGTCLFKSFTPSQAFILVLQIRNYGVESLPWTCFATSMFMVAIVMLQIEKFVRATPKCIILGLQFSTGNDHF